LAEALKVNTSIVNIGLQGNGISDEGAKAWRGRIKKTGCSLLDQ
jgi:hypothetical protein